MMMFDGHAIVVLFFGANLVVFLSILVIDRPEMENTKNSCFWSFLVENWLREQPTNDQKRVFWVVLVVFFWEQLHPQQRNIFKTFAEHNLNW